jgi:uncharacterized membrane protein
MMIAPLPFSGLSLLIHLAIIFVAWVLGLVGIKRVHAPEVGPTQTKKWSKRVTSLLLLVSMVLLTLTFIITAVATGIREGATENHRLIIDDVLGVVVTGVVDFNSLIEDRLEYHRTLIDWKSHVVLLS